MPKPFNFTALFTALILGTCIASTAFAADPVTDEMQEAYAPYRVALFKTNSNSQTEAQQAIAQAQQMWARLGTQFLPKPPAPYDRDPAFATALADVSKVYVKAADEAAANKLTQAHETLERARDLMADLRHRNQVKVYSDEMNAYHAQMERVLIDGDKILAGPNGMQRMVAEVGTLKYLADKLTTEAPVIYARNEEFVGSLKAVDTSVADLQAATFAQNAVAIKQAIAKIKGPYSKLFLKFG